MKSLFKHLGGSHSYGLNTPESDIDERGVFMNDDYRDILRITTHEHQKGPEGEDSMMYELRNFVNLLRRGNTQALEILFAKTWIEADANFVQMFVQNARRFIDSEKLFKCLRGYAQGEYRLAIGERTGVIGHKRHEQLKKYGFSPKNFTQLFRLLILGRIFFETDEFIVNCREGFPPALYDILMGIKTEPWRYTKEWLSDYYQILDKELEKAYNMRVKTYDFDTEYANECIFKLYMDELVKIQLNRSKKWGTRVCSRGATDEYIKGITQHNPIYGAQLEQLIKEGKLVIELEHDSSTGVPYFANLVPNDKGELTLAPWAIPHGNTWEALDPVVTKTNGGQPCDMKVGPCSCGSWHTTEDKS